MSQFGSIGNGNGQLWIPSAVTVTCCGEVFVDDSGIGSPHIAMLKGIVQCTPYSSRTIRKGEIL